MISKTQPFEPTFDAARWQNIADETKRRGKSQRGIPRVKDPAKYPLTCRVIDLTDGCGSVMYGRTSGHRPVYTCGRYMKFGNSACENNQVDGEALLRFTLDTLAELIDRLGARDKLRAKLLERARRDMENPEGSNAVLREKLVTKIKLMEQQKQQVARNFALAEDVELRQEIERIFLQIKQELDAARTELARLAVAIARSGNLEEEVEKALSLLDDIKRIANDTAARAAIPGLLKTLGFKIGLRFVAGIKGKKRQVRRLAGGVLALGQASLEHDQGEKNKTEPSSMSANADIYQINDRELPASAVPTHNRREDRDSSTMVNRSNKTPIELFAKAIDLFKDWNYIYST